LSLAGRLAPFVWFGAVYGGIVPGIRSVPEGIVAAVSSRAVPGLLLKHEQISGKVGTLEKRNIFPDQGAILIKQLRVCLGLNGFQNCIEQVFKFFFIYNGH
jgi:hypothetical protein